MEGTLRFRSEAVDPVSGELRPCCVLVDSGSSINITRPWCVGATSTHEHPLTIRALKQELLVDRCGEVVLMLPTGDGSGTREPVGFECYELDQIGPPSLGIDVLLSAAAGYELGYLAEKPSAASKPAWKLPRLVWKLERSARRAGHSRKGPVKRSEKPAERDIDLRHRIDASRVRDRLRARVNDAYVAMADAAVAEILKNKAFPLKGEACYSKDNIQWGTTGVDHTAEQRRQMEALIDEYHSIFCDEAFPPPCACTYH